MVIPVRSSEITPESVYLNRRQFMRGAAVMGMGAALLSACGPGEADEPPQRSDDGVAPKALADNDERGDPLNSYEDITNYNNYYEFSVSKQAVAQQAANFRTNPWTVEIGGLVHKPTTIGIEELLKNYPEQERIYRLRCVEAWSMVIPWLGFPLVGLLKSVEPMTSAKFVRFETLYDPEQMPGQKNATFKWPYVEGLRLDEALHDLTILSTGLYGKRLLPQNGAPLRLVVPWKYGFKSIKAITKIELVEEMPVSLWMRAAPNEYGFYANVSIEVDHPRWSQATERRIGELNRRKTLMFNGYSDEVAHLYADMDLEVNF